MRAVFLSGLFFAGAALAGTPAVDRYGQTAGDTWPGKIADDAELRADLERERRELADLRPDTDRYDRYGGLKEGTPRRASGFFRTEKIDGRWWLVTPEGNRFFLKGVDAVPYLERGYFTAAEKADGTPREVFAGGVPDRETHPEAWRAGGKQVNFLAANLRRKYGDGFRQAWMEQTEKRLRAWGFNASAKWNNPFVFDRLPYLLDHGLDAKRFDRYIDPFDPAFPDKVEARLRELAARHRDDPMLIGYQFENENGWSRSAPLLLLKDRSGGSAGKRALLEFLAERTGGDAGKFFSLADADASTETLMRTQLDAGKVPPELLHDFIRHASRRYHAVLAEALRRHDPNHLFLGASHCGHQSLEWIEGASEQVDLLPLHEYNLDVPWIGGTLAEKLTAWDKPFAVLEFSFTTRQRGFGVFSNSIDVPTEADRGRAYRMFTERLAADPRCVGFGYFTLHDQPVTRRGHDAEAFNFGLVDVTDRPYRDMLAGVKEANDRLFGVHEGRLAPMAPAALLNRPDHQAFMPGSVGAVRFDSSNPQFHHGRVNRIRFSENARFGVPLAVGTVDAGRAGGFKLLEFRVFLWKNEKNRHLDDWFTLEESPDNVRFAPAPATFNLIQDGPFPQYAMTPKALKSDTRYVRLNFILNDPAAPWATSLAATRVERN